jgi:hypothetical protein
MHVIVAMPIAVPVLGGVTIGVALEPANAGATPIERTAAAASAVTRVFNIILLLFGSSRI